MYKITCFLPVSFSELCIHLRGMHFRNEKGVLVWKADGHEFKICPFTNQNESDSTHGYRVSFNGSMDGGLFLFDMALNSYKPQVKGIEYELPLGERTQHEWIKELYKWRSIETIDTRGIFRKDSIGIVVVPDHVNLQVRPKRKKNLKMVECLKEIDKLREDITPSTYDLFSIIEEDKEEYVI
ncbi:hypothetical protein [Pontibacillus halophilus]|uniref:hypothetical protein n=1 Tax=Pontibacillus halophilus TaxID=516704 RepID=UPI0004788C05|nr:hypothetical protein [Pontibacillus halophilus]